MRETLIVIGLVVLVVGLRSSRKNLLRKLGALVLLLASFLGFYFISGSVAWGFAGVVMWFFLPWIELLTRIRRMRLPLNNRLSHREVPSPSFFPNATEAAAAMEEAGFEHISDCGWQWAGMQQFFRLYWHPEERAVASVCLCEQSNVAFAFVTVTSIDEDGGVWRTTNFPFAPTLECPPHIRWNPVPCERSCFNQILSDHQNFLSRSKLSADRLRMPDPEEIEDSIEREMRQQVDHNLAAGLIKLTGDGHFQYSNRGLFFLWGQFIKDMIRLC
ncbi:MAG: hypothetical protein ACRCXD_11220 [Luteolibacter sp.]